MLQKNYYDKIGLQILIAKIKKIKKTWTIFQ